MSAPLTDFLTLLATDQDELERFNSSHQVAIGMMTAAGLTEPQINALLAHDAAKVWTDLQVEGYSQPSCRIAAGPTKVGDFDKDDMFQITPVNFAGGGPAPSARPPRKTSKGSRRTAKKTAPKKTSPTKASPRKASRKASAKKARRRGK
jgi:hypothetical protein